MCLSKLAEFKIHKYHGWQVFSRSDNRLTTVFAHYNTIWNRGVITEPVPNKWQEDMRSPYKEDNVITIEDKCSVYVRGFHIFINKRNAIKYAKILSKYYGGRRLTIRKVRFKKVVTKGYQSRSDKYSQVENMPVIVALQRYIEGEEDDKT